MADRVVAIGYSIVAALTLVIVYSWFVPEPGPNELSHFDLVLALARDRVTSIDPYAANTIDRSFSDGHVYTNKAPGLALLGAPFLWILDRVLAIGPLAATRVAYVVHLIATMTVAIPGAIAIVTLGALARRHGAPVTSTIVASAAIGLATAFLPFATTLYSHVTAAAFIVVAFALLTWRHPSPPAAWQCVAAGLAAGFAVAIEFPAAIAFVALSIFSIATTGAGRRTIGFAVGSIVGLCPLATYNWISFGAPWRLSYGYTDFIAFEGMRRGLFGVGVPTWEGLAEILIGPSGLVTQSPFMLLLPVGALLASRRAHGPALVAIATALGFIAYNAGFWAPLGGQSSGPRYIVPALPLLGYVMAFVLRRLALAALPLVAAGFIHVAAIAAVEPKTGPGHANALFAYWLPALVRGDLATTWIADRWGLGATAVIVALAIPIALGLTAAALGLSRWWMRRWAVAPLLAISIVAWGLIVAPFGRGGVPERFRVTVAPPTESLGLVFDDRVELVAIEGPRSAAPRDTIDFDLYWRASAPIDANLVAFVHLVDDGGVPIAGRDGPPTGGGFPTNLWRPGEVYRARTRLRFEVSPERAPLAVRAIVGMYEPGGEPLPSRDRRGSVLRGGVPVHRIGVFRDPPGQATTPAQATFVGGIDLVAARVPPSAMIGGSATIALTWQATGALAEDATVFVQALGPDGPIAQWDAAPMRGRVPTGLWRPGDTFEDVAILTFSSNVPRGIYPVIVGLYTLPEIRRWPMANGVDFIEIGAITLEP
ncbi:MAG: hypothetical protein EPO26_08850 [Chloroflexota bacterium]|nr:MAG: hypothetical protein EPO26_08850 [Chloroflexota bacterium]